MASEFSLTIDEYPFEILADDICLIYWPEHEQYAELAMPTSFGGSQREARQP